MQCVFAVRPSSSGKSYNAYAYTTISYGLQDRFLMTHQGCVTPIFWRAHRRRAVNCIPKEGTELTTTALHKKSKKKRVRGQREKKKSTHFHLNMVEELWACLRHFHSARARNRNQKEHRNEKENRTSASVIEQQTAGQLQRRLIENGRHLQKHVRRGRVANCQTHLACDVLVACCPPAALYIGFPPTTTMRHTPGVEALVSVPSQSLQSYTTSRLLLLLEIHFASANAVALVPCSPPRGPRTLEHSNYSPVKTGFVFVYYRILF